MKIFDLFAGIGGFRLAAEQINLGKCIGSCEIDKFARKTYEANFTIDHDFHTNVRGIYFHTLPDFDLLTAGFPCQPFSIAGISKNNSLKRLSGFAYKDKGTLFHYITIILSTKQPEYFLLENVPNLVKHDSGKTFQCILECLELAGYNTDWKIISSETYTPQKRKRLFILGCKSKKIEINHQPQNTNPKLGEILEKNVDEKYTLSDKLWNYLQAYRDKQSSKNNGFGCSVCDINDKTRTLSARYYKDGSEILVAQKGKNPRKLTPRECARLMGFPDSFKFPVSDTQAYKQCGNSVVVPVIRDILERIK